MCHKSTKVNYLRNSRKVSSIPKKSNKISYLNKSFVSIYQNLSLTVSLYVYLYTYFYIIHYYVFSEQDKWSSQKRVKGCPLFTRDVFTMRIYRYRHTPRQRLANLALRSVSSKHFRLKVNLISYSVRASNIVTGFLMEMKYSFAYRKLSFERMGAAYEEFKSINIYIHIFI